MKTNRLGEQEIVLAGWIGLDEFGNGKYGLKQGIVPAGTIPLIAMDYHEHKMLRLKDQMEAQAAIGGKRIRLCRFVMTEVIYETEHGTEG